MHGTPTADYVRTWTSHTKLVGRGRRRGPGRARIIDVGGGDGTGASGSGVVFGGGRGGGDCRRGVKGTWAAGAGLDRLSKPHTKTTR